MPNWCYTSYVIEGDKNDLEKIERIFNEVSTEDSIGPNGVWVGHILKALGEDPKDMYLRAGILECYTEGNVLWMNVVSAWVEPEDFRRVLERQFPGVEVYYRAEEGGCGYYVTNDNEGFYFPDRYIVEVWDEGTEHFDDEQEALSYLSDILHTKIETTEQADEIIKQHNENSENRIYFNKYEVVN